MAMSISDQSKVLAAGFVLYRVELGGKKIKIARKPGSWETYGEYRTQRECKLKWAFLMTNSLYISG